MNERHAAHGMSLVEVLVALSILAVGLLGAAAVQIKALQYTDGSRMSTQASFIAYDMLDRVRANAGADYSVTTEGEGRPDSVRDQDLHDFAASITSFAGPSGQGSISTIQDLYTVRITWDDSRAEGREDSRSSLELSSRVAAQEGSP